MIEMSWKRSSKCAAGDCVEVANCNCPDGEILVRDSKDDAGPVLRFTGAEWSAFVAGVKAGEFDLR